jgi:two-component system CheB/CheR fusion protein
MKTQKKKSVRTKESSALEDKNNPDTVFPIIGIGASAGGLEAFEQFFRNMPPDSGMAFILITHLDPDHVSMLTEIIQRVTVMPVHEAQDRMTVMPNHVYVIPPNKDIAIFHGALHLSIPENPRGLRMPIDFFLRSLAEEQGERAIGVILSGNGTDGTLGLRAIHGAGGISFVQEPSSAKFDGMPVSAIRSGLAAYIMPVEKMPEQMMSYKKTFYKKKIKSALPAPVVMGDLSKILMLIRSRTGHDFSLYKQSTIRRRIERRMTIHCIEDVNIYARFLKEHPDETLILFKELLINVTNFFRDFEAFAVLKKDILPEMFAQKPENYVFRIWIPGCATGEEAYSIAIAFREYMDDSGQEFKVQIYATDMDDDAIKTARFGIYPANIAIDVSQERLRRFFAKEDIGYRVRKDIREMVVFASQNVIKDPPFTRLDMLSCRNVLIYLEAELQNRLIPMFHYALKPAGILFLSPSESIGNLASDLFAPINKKWKFYQAKPSVSSAHRVLTQGVDYSSNTNGKLPDMVKKKTEKPVVLAELIQTELLRFYAPPSVISDENGNILYIYGETGKYLQPAPGQPNMNLFEMAREGLQSELMTAIRTAAMQKKEVICNACPVKTNGGIHEVNLIVRPLTDSEAYSGLLMVSFTDMNPEGKPVRKRRNVKPSKRADELEQELIYTKENLHATIEELQASNEELKSTNEELQSTNEELQSTNEEIETSKEELQSVNEELVTVNSELQSKIEQLAGMQNDMKNLLDSMNIGTIFLDNNLFIKRFTREAVKLFRMAATDIGRPLNDIKSDITNESIIDDAQAVLDSLVPREKEIFTTENNRYMLRILPYRTLENVIDGVVMTFTDITERKKRT